MPPRAPPLLTWPESPHISASDLLCSPHVFVGVELGITHLRREYSDSKSVLEQVVVFLLRLSPGRRENRKHRVGESREGRRSRQWLGEQGTVGGVLACKFLGREVVISGVHIDLAKTKEAKITSFSFLLGLWD